MLKTINMKKVIRLTEYDLTRIVKRVLKEESEVIKIKAWDNEVNFKNGASRSHNFDTTNHTLKNNRVFFNAQIVGTDGKNSQGTLSSGLLSYRCGAGTNHLNVENSSLGTHMQGGKLVPLNYLYVTPEAIKLLTKKCDAYASNDTKVNGDYA
jgi:hypothetical protein